MILTAADRLRFFPSLALSGSLLDGAILAAQNTAVQATRRSLELQEYTEGYDLDGNRQAVIRHAPIRMDKPIVVTGYDGCAVRPLTASDYTLDADGFFNGKVWTIFSVRISYWSGFDFAKESSPEIDAIKASIASILLYQCANAGG